MMASTEQTYNAVARAMHEAENTEDFGRQILSAGKTKGSVGREIWLSKKFASALKRKGFGAAEEFPDGNKGRIDIAILDSAKKLEGAVEVKFYFCHQFRHSDKAHLYLGNTLKDFAKGGAPRGPPASDCPSGRLRIDAAECQRSLR